jgi:lipoprotein-releasing system permease protein
VRSYELFVGLRYTRAKRRNRAISFIAAVSIIGIALGMTALITVLSVMNGFQREIRTRILEAAAHVEIMGPDKRLENWQLVAKEALQNPQVIAAAPYISDQGLLSAGANVRGVLVRGIDPSDEMQVDAIGKHMKLGSFDALKPGRFGIVLGSDLAAMLGVGVGDKVVLIAPQGLVTPAGVLPRLRQFTVVGIFQIGHYQYDSSLALINFDDARALYRMGNAVTGVRLRLKDLFKANQVVHQLSHTITTQVYLTDWTMEYATFFRAVEIEKRMMFIVVILIIAVAAFNIVSSLIMVVTDKRPDIAILRTLGASPGSITKIFFVQGALIGIFGTALGLICGVSLAYNIPVVVPFIEHLFGVHFLAKSVYYISELPSQVQAPDVIATALVSLALSLLATLYPSYRAAKVNPAEALRYE